ncbi:MAG: hypothetical protein RLZZ618_37 [Pseudomonadota bacterium]|jgi:pimeloyl-ACP methyl ester carboxylesterase
MKITSPRLHLEVEVSGSPQGIPLLMIMGLGMQLTAWDERLVARLVSQGFRVIRFDNRDSGLSQGFDHLGLANVARAATRRAFRLPVSSPYSLVDMAADAVDVLDALGISSAHVCGISMGGMVAQWMALRHPSRVLSLSLLMTNSGARRLPGPTFAVRMALMRKPPVQKGPAAVLDNSLRFLLLVESPAHRSDVAELRKRLADFHARAYRPEGTARQLTAIAASPDRSAMLRTLKLPCEIVHGRADPLVRVAAGVNLKSLIPGSRLDIVEGMGHDLPQPLFERVTAAIGRAASRV